MSHHYSGPDFGFPHGNARLDLTDLYAFPKPGDAGNAILIMNVHPSEGVNPSGPTTTEPFASQERGAQAATLRRVEGEQAAGTGDSGQTIIEGAPVSTGREARVTEAG